MSFLGLDFIISSLFWLTLVFSFMFLFRKKLFTFYYKSNNFDKFIEVLKKQLKQTYPKLTFDFSLIEDLKNEPNPQAKQYLLIDNIISQYQTKQFIPPKTTSVPTNKLWPTYVLESKPTKSKLPNDWMKRKLVVYERDNKICQRCSKNISLKNSNIFMINSLQNKGQYYLENLILLCLDCDKIEKNKRDSSIKLNYLEIKNELYSLVK